jgi:hypothetical protein
MSNMREQFRRWSNRLIRKILIFAPSRFEVIDEQLHFKMQFATLSQYG